MTSSTAHSLRTGTNRRQFIKIAGGLGLAGIALPSIIPSAVLGADGNVAASKRVTLGVIGTGNQGINDLRAFLGDNRVQVVALVRLVTPDEYFCALHRDRGGPAAGNPSGATSGSFVIS